MVPVQFDLWRTGIHSKGLFIFPCLIFLMLVLVGCGGRSQATRTPVPTWTATPAGGVSSGDNGGVQAAAVQPSGDSGLAVAAAPVNPPAAPAQVVEPTLPPVEAPIVAEASTPTLTPQSDLPTETPEPTATPAPTDTPTPTETSTPLAFDFTLETTEKFPTGSLAENVVRVFLYAYADGGFALPGYTINVTHDGVELPVEAVSAGGLPVQTRSEPSPYTRFTNLNSIFIEPQEGTWEIQLVDDQGIPAGPPALFELTKDDNARELYVRYRRK